MDGADKMKKQAVVCVLAAGFVTPGMVLSLEEGGKGARDVCDSVFILGGALQFVKQRRLAAKYNLTSGKLQIV